MSNINNQINKINHIFYQTYASSFSQTRQYPWPGWQPVIHQLDRSISHTILDLGCGNGRFLYYLLSQQILLSTYVGIDQSEAMLKQIREQYFEMKQISFRQVNLLTDEWVASFFQERRRFDLIVIFGVMHHLASIDQRLSLLLKAEKLLSDHGLLAVSFWQFNRDPRFEKMNVLAHKNAQNKLDLNRNDYLLSWQGRFQTPRFAHFFTHVEIETLTKALPMNRLLSWCADGKHMTNHYELYQKRS